MVCRRIYTVLNPEGRQMFLSGTDRDSASANGF